MVQPSTAYMTISAGTRFRCDLYDALPTHELMALLLQGSLNAGELEERSIQ